MALGIARFIGFIGSAFMLSWLIYPIFGGALAISGLIFVLIAAKKNIGNNGQKSDFQRLSDSFNISLSLPNTFIRLHCRSARKRRVSFAAFLDIGARYFSSLDPSNPSFFFLEKKLKIDCRNHQCSTFQDFRKHISTFCNPIANYHRIPDTFSSDFSTGPSIPFSNFAQKNEFFSCKMII